MSSNSPRSSGVVKAESLVNSDNSSVFILIFYFSTEECVDFPMTEMYLVLKSIYFGLKT